MDDPLEQRLRFLREVHTREMPHSGRDLFDHLLGTRALLIAWGERPAVCDAGLFHSIYGTEHYELAACSTDLRDDVRRLIGPEAESLAWLFCAMRRESFDQNLTRRDGFSIQDRSTGEIIPLSAAQFHDLVTLTFANTLEAFPRLSWIVRRRCRAYLQPFRAFANPAAQGAFAQVAGPGWKFWW